MSIISSRYRGQGRIREEVVWSEGNGNGSLYVHHTHLGPQHAIPRDYARRESRTIGQHRSHPQAGEARTHTHTHTHTQNTLDVHSRTMNGERTTADNRNDGARVHDFSGFSGSSFVAITTNEAKRKTGVGRLAETSAGKVASDHRCAAASVKNGLH